MKFADRHVMHEISVQLKTLFSLALHVLNFRKKKKKKKKNVFNLLGGERLLPIGLRVTKRIEAFFSAIKSCSYS